MPSVIEDIAKELNISTASVSRALNDKPGVSAELRTKVLEKAREMQFAASFSARGLATSQTFGLGFFVREKPGLSTYTDPFYGEILHGAEQALAQSNYHLTIANLTDEILAAPAQFRFVRERRVDGMILAGPDIPSDFILAMIKTQLPVVLVDNYLEHSQAHCINADDEGGAFLGARHLLALGHERIGVLSGPHSWPSNRRRLQGYRRALAEVGLSAPVIVADRTTIDSGQAAFRQLIAEAPSITGVLAVNDSMAIGAIRAARAVGRHVPADLSVIGFDNISWAELNDPPLTTLDAPKVQLGVEAANRLVSLLATTTTSSTQLTVAVQLVERASSGPPPR